MFVLVLKTSVDLSLTARVLPSVHFHFYPKYRDGAFGSLLRYVHYLNIGPLGASAEMLNVTLKIFFHYDKTLDSKIYCSSISLISILT